MMPKKRRSGQNGCLFALAFLAIVSLAQSVYAYSNGTYGSGAYGACQYGSACSITLIASGAVGLNVSPAVGSKCTIGDDTVSVQTDDANGYNLALANGSTNTALIDGAKSISAISSTSASPSPLSGNTWGYRVDNVANFGSGPTSAQTNISPNSLTFSATPASNQTADTLAATTTAAATPTVSSVWYGICANVSAVSGSYTSQVLYTAVAN
jgi:hypothetical protein